jgi:DNA-binding response OmpR family regulator
VNAATVILVVEDEGNVRECIQWMLEFDGYQVLEAKDGCEALEVLESHHVDLILCDIAMPRMNGYQLHERVTGDPRWVRIPFVFLTARSMDSDIRYGKELGVDDYVTKPFRSEDLLVVVRGRLRRARQLAAARPISTPEHSPPAEVLVLGRLRLDLGQHRVWLDEKRIKLSAREFRLLACLARQERKAVPLEELIQATHRLNVDRTEAGSLLRPLVRSLRRKLGYPAGDMGCIENVRSVGYMLVPPMGRGGNG